MTITDQKLNVHHKLPNSHKNVRTDLFLRCPRELLVRCPRVGSRGGIANRKDPRGGPVTVAAQRRLQRPR